MEKRGMWEEKEGQEKKRRTEFFTRKLFFSFRICLNL